MHHLIDEGFTLSHEQVEGIHVNPADLCDILVGPSALEVQLALNKTSVLKYEGLGSHVTAVPTRPAAHRNWTIRKK